ncbi:MAG: helical backbone metal receptor [Armatimonadetes bacterium]|nr:helical backbone metal receptor [Armatimonadota bacterium]
MTLTDDLGRRLTLPRPARRIVSLSPVTTENLFAIGAEKLIVGVTSACDFPEEAKKLPRIGDFTRPSYERLLALKPDLIVFDSTTVKLADVESFAARVKIPIFVQCSRNVQDVPRHLEALGQLAGKPATALAAQVRRALRLPLRSNLIPVFVQISASPLYAVGPGSFVDELISLAGGQNVVREGGEFPQLTKEKLLTLRPQVYVIATNPGQPETPPALSNVRVVRIPADLLFRATPRLATGLRMLMTAFRMGDSPTGPFMRPSVNRPEPVVFRR